MEASDVGKEPRICAQYVGRGVDRGSGVATGSVAAFGGAGGGIVSAGIIRGVGSIIVS